MLKGLEDKLTSFNQELRIMRKKEISRIFKAFMFNDYERRFEAKLQKVFCAIIGEDHWESEMFRQKREIKVNLKIDYFVGIE